ncbi:hypothetical protein SPRG_22195 [Saprolegnia parasitica CBS 223.65]|uniref:Translation initiation factor eIF2B subunit epsilon n=1 Tax=Saprolegnia parasitica (strain CBS 223.65) TaxID=695850 RepID=A0A067CFN8_SAPPC|nr:hypothetical protein SPRG_22195 [Saprolegnia parasitica CBS 223.65]KDO27995.1 hypothetical protein SPRG_22195 [Saprolegnia parasitica CBS 223.65]|eukprot:XP_012201471.1 hypothetical protein SPRG_22195 [Saprolegnia parasitica CBS 223.65]
MPAIHQYQVVGRKAPTESDPNPPAFRMKLFAPNEVLAKSRFWYFLHQMKKMKKTTGEILCLNELREKNKRIVKNYGVWIRYNSRSGTHNMYKEYRDVTLCGAVEQMYAELAGRHRARPRSIQIMRTAILAAKDCKNAQHASDPKAAAMAPKKQKGEQKDEKHKHPLQAVIFADSWTKTFRPISLETPKVLLPLANVPMLEYTLEFLASNGVEEVLIFCTAHAAAIEAFLATSVIAQTVKTQCILAPTCLTAGDAIRELDRMQAVRSDPFILISGDVVSNMNLKGAIESHEARKKKDSTSIMTVVMKEVQLHHDIRPLTDDLLVAMDTATNQIVLYESSSSHAPSALLPTAMFQDHKQIGFRYDLMDAHVDICSPEVLLQFSDNFDYQDMRRDFIRNEVLNYEMGNRIHAHIISKEFAARVHDPRTYAAISHAILQRWAYPMVPDNNFLGLPSTYRHQRGDIYKEDDVQLARTCTVRSTSIVGGRTTIGANTDIVQSAIGRDCKIGQNVRIAGSFLWDNVTIEDDVVLEGAIVCNGAVIRKGAIVQEGALISFNVVVGPKFTVPSYTKLTTVRATDDDDGFSSDDDDSDKDATTTTEALGDDAWLPKHVGVNGVGRIWTLDDDEIYLDGSDDEDDDDDDANQAARLHRLKQTLIGAKEVVTARTSRLASWDALSESDDEEPLNAFEEEDPMARFVRVVMDMVLSGDANGDDVENLFLEIKSFKFAQNRSFADCLEAILPALCNAIPRANKAPMAIMGLLKAKLEKWSGVVSKCIMNDVERVKIVDTLAAYCVHATNSASFGSLFRYILQVAYDLDWITEETVFGWEDKVLAEAPSHPEQALLKAAAMQEFLEWLREDDDDSDDDDDDDDDDSDDE